MENAVEALKMAFAVMVFVMALSVSMVSFNKAKATSDIVLYSKDETNYYDYQGATGKASENRIVGIETIVPTLYKYYKENYTVVFRSANYSEAQFSNIKPLYVYTTESKRYADYTHYRLWSDGYDELMDYKYKPIFKDYKSNLDNKIFSFDLEEETLRHEPWTGSYSETKKNIDCFLNGGTYERKSDKKPYIQYESFIQNNSKARFVETVAEYDVKSRQEDDVADEDESGSRISNLAQNKKNKKRIIIFTKIN